jgi:hypothetical protein
VVGTQNRNGYTGFARMTMDDFMLGIDMPGDEAGRGDKGNPWVRVVQIPLPSFAGKVSTNITLQTFSNHVLTPFYLKDEALFVFQRGDRAPKDAAISS